MVKTSQPYARLNNGIEMPLLGLGVYDMYNAEAEQAVHNALEIGYRLIDTAALYNNEAEIGNAVRQSGIKRQDIFITTKVGNTDHGFDATLKAFDVSLDKLKMDYVDLYLVHWPIKGLRKDTWLALEKLYADKRVRAIGVANYLIPFLDELEGYATVPPALDQVEFTPWLFDKALLQYCKQRNIQLQSYSPITRGKKFDDPRLLQLCEKYGQSPAQVILRWNIEHGVSTIPKSSSKTRLQENFDVISFSLSPEDVRFMDGFNEGFRICDNPMDML
ncbi:aldo/keto reductase [Flavihumibacter fluvii]|uniref:aldo/keto reductase n=1 Tax=Flavihumibacter fluvii TaxID=2838157 RepID=UPI001BDF1ECD|nr:aldo/keto reductase [Flavihumibacter fluvii]ULQ51801.1 aldo/keto reductase [Flavihumibacter fluvii]